MNNISVMIVDDDKIILDDIHSQYNWSENGFEIVAKAFNGIQALKYFHEFNPQIIIMDIVMPALNGIEVLKEVRQTEFYAYVLLLTSHDDFNYAKQGLKYGANDYILKNELTPAVLHEKLSLIKEDILKKKQYAAFLVQKILLDYFKNGYINQLSQFVYKDKSIQKFIQGTDFIYVALQLNKPLFDAPSRAEDSFYDDILLFVSEFKPVNLSVEFCIPITNGQVLLIINTFDAKSHFSFHNNLFDFCIGFIGFLMQKADKNFTAIYSSLPQTIEEFYSFYNKLGLESRCFVRTNPTEQVIDMQTLVIKTDEPQLDYSIQSLKELVKKEDENAIKQFLKDHSETYSKLQGYTIRTTELIDLFKQMDDLYASCTCSHLSTPEIYSYHDLLNWCISVLKSLFGNNNLDERNISLPTLLTIEYVNKNYNDPDLSIPLLADRVSLSKGYLCTLFRVETNKSINEFITEVRLKEAKRFLKDPSYKVYEIASLVGYSSSQYFSQIFFKFTGMTPKDYRRSKGHVL